MLKIASMERPEGAESISGATRMKATIATFLGQAGYDKEEALKIFKAVSNQVGGPETNIFESWYKKMSCPACDTIKKKGSGFPHMDMGELELCQPNDYCKGIKNPIEYIATVFPFKINNKNYAVKFRKEKNNLIYNVGENGETGLETKVPMTFFQNDSKRKSFYSNICRHIGIEGKAEKKEITKIIDERVLNKLQKTIAAEKPKQMKKKQERTDHEIKIINKYSTDQVITKIQTNDSTRIVHTTNGIFWEQSRSRTNKFGELEQYWAAERIYNGYIKPVVKMLIDGEFTVFRYKGDMEQVADIPTIIRSMKKGGGVLNKNRFDDCLNAIFLDLPQKTGHATFGVYEKNKKLELCLDVMPLRDKQRQIKIRGEPAVEQKITKETLKPYFKVLEYWSPYEVLPSMGAGGISPFALMLRKQGKLVPIIWNFSMLSRLGKSLVQKIFSLYLFSVFPVTGDAVNSKYRLSTVFDAVGTYFIVDEGEQVHWSDLEGLLKEAPENFLCNIRGTPEQGIIQYLSRAILGINSNSFKIHSENVLVRILKIEFDTSVVGDRAGNETEVESLTETISELYPIGWRLIELYLDEIQYSMDVLLERISKHEKAFKKLYKNFIDPRRATAWAVMYEGLKVWEHAAKKFGIEWTAPPYENYVEKVIDKIETTTRETGETPIEDFMQWWEMWKTLHVDRVRDDEGFIDTPKGKDVIWAEKTLDWEGKTFSGDVITGAVLREYKNDKKSKIDNLADLQKAITIKTSLPKLRLLTSWKIGREPKWGLFLPDDLMMQEAQEKLPVDETDGVEDKNHTKQQDFSNQSRDIERIEMYISEAGGKDKTVTNKGLYEFIKNVLGEKNPEKYLDILKQKAVITDYGNDKIKFTGKSIGNG